MTEIIHIDDSTTRADLIEALSNLNRYAKHQLHHQDNARWVRAHERMNALLDEYEIAK